MICIATGRGRVSRDFVASMAGMSVKQHSRQIGHGQRGIGVEVVRLDEALKQIPTHLGRLIGARRREGEEGMCSSRYVERRRGMNGALDRVQGAQAAGGH
jgi:hypothetical protein